RPPIYQLGSSRRVAWDHLSRAFFVGFMFYCRVTQTVKAFESCRRTLDLLEGLSIIGSGNRQGGHRRTLEMLDAFRYQNIECGQSNGLCQMEEELPKCAERADRVALVDSLCVLKD
ncbi:MAG: hypothetical protein SFV81_02340, partial [Pirellulaceae bacterium]|nr:hypothetical protein [Pirellulaceae bacterium]